MPLNRRARTGPALGLAEPPQRLHQQRLVLLGPVTAWNSQGRPRIRELAQRP
jgi:hypothetical protein